mmetsp:Transcript_40581/g.61544  ORF Transcript_40581/g.61544 Transcript_40581/m.61544 type:complete len:90 (-) Transcript_40581:323-592(-)
MFAQLQHPHVGSTLSDCDTHEKMENNMSNVYGSYKEWINTPLVGPNAYRNVEYVRIESDKYWCLLCGTGGMPKKQVHHHFEGERHKKKI